MTVLLSLLQTFSLQELRHHPWRNAAGVVAVMLGVALAFAVHLINASALTEFSSAVRAVNGQSDLELRGMQGLIDEALLAQVARHPDVLLASPVLELSSYTANDAGTRTPLRVLGVDALVVAQLAPALLALPAQEADRLDIFAPDAVFLNATAQTQLLAQGQEKTSTHFGQTGSVIRLQSGLQWHTLRVAGRVNAGGNALAVMDIAAAQELFDKLGLLSRIDLRLRPGALAADVLRTLALPSHIQAVQPGDAAQRVSNLSRAYRVNLTVLALVALFTGAFLVYSVLALSVAKRAQQFALLGVLGLTARQRLHVVLLEALALGSVGSGLGLALGSALAALALTLLGGDLGGAYFTGLAPPLQWDSAAALLYGGLGVLAALLGAWWPARQAQALPLALTLKGLGANSGTPMPRWVSVALLMLGLLLGLAPPLLGLPLAAYASVALLLLGGILALPALIALLLNFLAPRLQHRLLPLLAVERSRRVRANAVMAVSGVVAALSLAVALTVMVASFRESVTRWLDVVLPAELYLRSANSSGASDTVYFTPEFVQAVSGVTGVARVQTQRSLALLLAPEQPSVTLIARRVEDAARNLPLVGPALVVPAGQIGIYVSEAMVDLHGARMGANFTPLSSAFSYAQPYTPTVHPEPVQGLPPAQSEQSLATPTPKPPAPFFVAGIWRDYARQGGAIVMDARDFERLTGDRRANDLSLWLAPSADSTQVQTALRALLPPTEHGLIEFASASQIRATSLKIFDRSFAVTYWLQAVAIGIGLFGIAASFSAQVLARRKEMGLLLHLGLTRKQILTVVALEGAAWTAIGALAGVVLGLAVAVVLVYVVNPQSFHWSMDLSTPWLRLLGLSLAVLLAGTLTAWLAARAAAGQDAVLAVKEDS